MSEMAESATFACPGCGRRNWLPGRLTAQYGVGFMPFYKKWRPYSIRAFVCLDCGYIAQFVAMEDVEDIRQKVPRKPKE
jgi:hypothetical protein